jgi:putative toxin-antitoxin system antitoxin component (TIGR02293 family)
MAKNKQSAAALLSGVYGFQRLSAELTGVYIPTGDENLRTLAGEVRKGLATTEVRVFILQSGLNPKSVMTVAGISPRTLERRSGATLSSNQSDRVARVMRILGLASEVIGDEERGRDWIQSPNRSLNGEVPLELLDTDAGTRLVEDVLGRLSDGVFA